MGDEAEIDDGTAGNARKRRCLWTESGAELENAEAKFAARWTRRTSSDPQEKGPKGNGFKGQSKASFIYKRLVTFYIYLF
jgi:hypothetical protein